MEENFDGRSFQNKAVGFEVPTQLPAQEDTAKQWQDANRSWWEKSPMRYDWRAPIEGQSGTKEYFEEIDHRFLESARHYLPWGRHPFESLIPYDNLKAWDVLEIGVGQGTHAQLIAPHCKSFVGIDLTEAASASTRKRLELARIDGTILRMDAESMSFPNNSFDFIWSWGVIHHSANTQNVLREMYRVLRPGGVATVMVYYRSFIQYYLINGLARGLLYGEFWKIGGIHKINQAHTDGALARYFTVADFSRLLDRLFMLEKIWITGQKSDVIPIPSCGLKTFLVKKLPDSLTRFATDRLRIGTFLIARIRRI